MLRFKGDTVNLVCVEYHADLKEVQSDAGLSALLSPACQVAPFDRLDWWRGLASACAMDPVLAVARDGSAQAVLPLARTRDHLESLANWYTFRFRPLVSAECDPRPLFDALARDLASRTHRLVLNGVPDEDGSATLLETAFRGAGWTVVREQCDINHVLAVGGRSWEEYFAQRPGQLRSTVTRKARKLDCRIYRQFDAQIWQAYEDIYAESWKPAEGSLQFLRDFAGAEGALGHLRLGVASAGERAVAAQLWTVEGGTAFIHKLAYRPSAGQLSPGSVLSAAMFRHVIEQDHVHMIDYGTGDDPYKHDWMEEARPRYRLEIFRPRSPRNWIALAKPGLRRLAGIGWRG